MINAFAEARGMGHDHAHAQIQRLAQAQRIAQALVFLCFHGLLLSRMGEQNHFVFTHFFIKGFDGRIGRVHAHRIRQPLEIAYAGVGPFLQLLQSIAPIRVNGNNRQKNIRIAPRQLDNVLVRNVHPGLCQIRRAVGVIMFVESQDAISARLGRARQPKQPRDVFLVGILVVMYARGALVDPKLDPFEIDSGAHLRIDESTGNTRTDRQNMSVMINPAHRVNAA